MRETDLPQLEAMPLADSKRLSPAQREGLYAGLRKLPSRIMVVRLGPQEVDAAVGSGGLNALEIAAMVRLIRKAAPSAVFVDALTSLPRRFGRQLEALVAPQAPLVVAENRADDKYPLVMAASIIAKVTRDAVVAALGRRYGDFGSGYPGDLKTRVFLSRAADSGVFPRCVRKSWATIGRLRERMEGRK